MVFLNFYAPTVNISYGFRSVKIIYMGLEFYNAMMIIFLFYSAGVEK